MIEQGLQQEINMVMTEARNRRLEFVTVLKFLHLDQDQEMDDDTTFF